MHWFFIALAGPALWSITNHLDKFLLSRYFKGGGAGSLVIFSSLIGFFVMPFIYFFNPHVLTISPINASLIMLSSVFLVSYIIPYFYALIKDEASIVVPLFQLVPVINYILGFIFLGEVLTIKQVIASLLIVGGGIAIALEITKKKVRIKKEVFFLMLLSSFLFALGQLVFKYIGLQETFWVTSFWGYLGYGIIGVLIFSFYKPYRKQFLHVITENKLSILSTNGLNETINVLAQSTTNFATLLAPLALVNVVSGFQPLFVFLYGIVITLFFPKLGKESLLKKHLLQKIIAIIVMLIGTYILHA